MTKDASIIKLIIDEYTREKNLFYEFITEKKLTGEFIKFCSQYQQRYNDLNSGFNKKEGEDENGN